MPPTGKTREAKFPSPPKQYETHKSRSPLVGPPAPLAPAPPPKRSVVVRGPYRPLPQTNASPATPALDALITGQKGASRIQRGRTAVTADENLRTQTKRVQEHLRALGYNVSVDGVMGPQTRAAMAMSHNGTQPNLVHNTDASRRAAHRHIEGARLERGNTAHRRVSYTPYYKGQSPAGTYGAFRGPDGKLYLPGKKAPTGSRITQIPYYLPDEAPQPGIQSVLGQTDGPGQQQALGTYRSEQSPSPLLTGTVHPFTNLLQIAVGQKPATVRGVASDVAQAATFGIPIAGTAERAAMLVGDIARAITAEGVSQHAVEALRAARAGRVPYADQLALRRATVAAKAEDNVPIFSPQRDALEAAMAQAPNVSRREARNALKLWDRSARGLAKVENITPEEAYSRLIRDARYHDINPTPAEASAMTGTETFQRGDLTSFPSEAHNATAEQLKAMAAHGDPSVPFTSKLHKFVLTMPDKMGTQEVLGRLKSVGIKEDEIKWNRFDTFLLEAQKSGRKSVTRQEALSWLDENYLKMEENVRSNSEQIYAGSTEDAESDQTKFSTYALPGAPRSNYREFTIRLPADEYGSLYQYTGHFPDWNILAHARTTDRVVDGDRSFFIEEIQSDWHQAGQKRGYRRPLEEHPDYAMRKQALDQAQGDVDSISGRIRQTIADALLSHPDLNPLPDALHSAFLREAEVGIGLNLTDPYAIREWLDKLERAEAQLRLHPDARAEVTRTEGAVERYYVKVNDVPIAGPFTQYSYDDAKIAQANANRAAIDLNNVLDMRPADREALKTSVEAYHRALTDLRERSYSMRALEEDVNRGVADAPFRQTWHELAFKRMLAKAVEEGFDRVAWTTGRTQAERYGLANYFSRIEIKEGNRVSEYELQQWADEMGQSAAEDADPEDALGHEPRWQNPEEYVQSDYPYPDEADFTDDEGVFDQDGYDQALSDYEESLIENAAEYRSELEADWREGLAESEANYYYEHADDYDMSTSGGYTVRATKSNGEVVEHELSESDSLEEVVGADLARAYHENGQAVFEGEDLVMGEHTKSALGAQHFYDNKLTGFVRKYLKKFGVEPEKSTIGSNDRSWQLRVDYKGGTSRANTWSLEAPSGGTHTFTNYFHALNMQHSWYGDIPRATLARKSLYDVYGPGHFADPHPEEEKVWVQWSEFPEGVTHATREPGRPLEEGTDWGSDIWGPWENAEDAAVAVEDMLITKERQAGHAARGAEGTVVHSIAINDAVRAFASEGQALFQRDPFVRGVRRAHGNVKGSVELGGRKGSALYLFQRADITTLVHELGHILQQYLPEMHGIEQEEFARSFERYFAEGIAPKPEEQKLFDSISSAMLAVYKRIDRIPGANLTPEVRQQFDSFFSREAARNPAVATQLARDRANQDEAADPMLEAAAMQVTQGGMSVEDSAKMFGLDPEALRTHIEGGGHESEQARILSNADVGAGAAESEESVEDILKRWFQEETPDGEPEWPVVDESLANTNEPVSGLSPEEQVRKGLAGARSMYGRQKVLRGEEAKRRSQEVEKALRTIADPDEAMAAASAAMRGEMPRIELNGEMRVLDGPTLRELKSTVNHHDALLPFQKIRLNKALHAAVVDHRLPTPSELRLIEHVFGKQSAIGITQHAGGGWGDVLINILNIPRSLMATADFSAVGRQALVAGASHPIIWSRSFPTMFRAMKSPGFYDKAMEELKNESLYPLALAARISFTDIGEASALAAHEEQFASDYAAQMLELVPKLTGDKVHINVVKGSARAYTAFLNKLRMDLFKHHIRIAVAAGRDVQDEKFLSDIGDVINAATGRGTIHGRAEHIMPALNTFLFSPRLMLSRINYLDPTWYYRLKGQARREALRGLFATAGVVTSTLWLFSQIPGVDIGSTDPRSADWGKLRVGDTRIDVAGGFQQYVRLAAELLTNTSVSSATGRKRKLGDGYGAPTRFDVITNFAVNKLAPAGSIAVASLRGKDAVGNPAGLTTVEGAKHTAVSNFTPLILQDAKDIYKESGGGMNGLALALGGYGISAFGEGLQTYGAPDPAKKPTENLTKKAKEAGVSPPGKEILVALDHKSHLDDISRSNKGDPQAALAEAVRYYAEITKRHDFDRTVTAAKGNDVLARQMLSTIRTVLVGPGLAAYESAVKTAAEAQGVK